MSAKLPGVLGLLVVAITPIAAIAQVAPQPGASQDRERPGTPARPEGDRPGTHHPEADRPGNGYGTWDDRWGAHPPEPPRHWTKKSDWHRHVRACQQRYRSYDARTDMFTVRQGVTRRCAL